MHEWYLAACDVEYKQTNKQTNKKSKLGLL